MKTKYACSPIRNYFFTGIFVIVLICIGFVCLYRGETVWGIVLLIGSIVPVIACLRYPNNAAWISEHNVLTIWNGITNIGYQYVEINDIISLRKEDDKGYIRRTGFRAFSYYPHP
jgi:hypothetical protein